jgi:hypothetical protein
VLLWVGTVSLVEKRLADSTYYVWWTELTLMTCNHKLYVFYF